MDKHIKYNIIPCVPEKKLRFLILQQFLQTLVNLVPQYFRPVASFLITEGGPFPHILDLFRV